MKYGQHFKKGIKQIMGESINCEVTNMVMIHNKKTNEVLVQDRRKNWCGIAFPGGHLETAESVMDSAVREVKEETGLNVYNLQYCGMVHWCNKKNSNRTFIFYYKTDTFDGELIAETDEGVNFWTDLDTLRDLKLAPGFVKQLGLFLVDDFNELFITYDDESDDIEYGEFYNH
jgi:8-oxo-dGTP diphosphatase